jgi:hypothetical protein
MRTGVFAPRFAWPAAKIGRRIADLSRALFRVDGISA